MGALTCWGTGKRKNKTLSMRKSDKLKARAYIDF